MLPLFYIFLLIYFFLFLYKKMLFVLFFFIFLTYYLMVIKSDTSNFITPYFLFRFLILHIFVLNTIIPCHFFQFFISCNHEHLYDLTCQKIEAASCVLLFYDSMFTFSAICSLSPTEFIAILGIRF